MPKGSVKIIQANDKIILEISMGKDYRLTIPTSLRHLLKPTAKLRVTIETI